MSPRAELAGAKRRSVESRGPLKSTNVVCRSVVPRVLWELGDDGDGSKEGQQPATATSGSEQGQRSADSRERASGWGARRGNGHGHGHCHSHGNGRRPRTRLRSPTRTWPRSYVSGRAMGAVPGTSKEPGTVSARSEGHGSDWPVADSISVSVTVAGSDAVADTVSRVSLRPPRSPRPAASGGSRDPRPDDPRPGAR